MGAQAARDDGRRAEHIGHGDRHLSDRGYMGEEETRGAGFSLLGMIVACLVLQLLLVFAQYRKRPKRTMAKEALIVLTAMKPAVGAYRLVSSGAPFKATGSIPFLTLASLAQMYVLLKVRNLSRATVGSVIVSAITTGFSRTSIGWDYDVDPTKRKE